MTQHAVFLISAADRKGLLAETTMFFYQRNFNILHCRQYTDATENSYFMRIKIDLSGMSITRRVLEDEFAQLGKKLNFTFNVYYSDAVSRVAVMVSKTSHCLYDLLVRREDGFLNCEIPLIISNHPDLESVADRFHIPFYCCPIRDKAEKPQQEAQIIELCEKHHIDLVVMARYMQVLSDDFISRFNGNIINIHHAFLPAFQGGNPYNRAWERGVKMIGATAHYATADLDEGPIIEQDVERVSHEHTPDDLKEIGRDIERRVLTRAVKAHLDHRIILSGHRTIIF
ncbi:MAG: formyltetrahydrofolate deformylase [Lentisphaerae bacterium]|nr:formyltetrahydrofolate deformylase [Lentisphaerota bacterium]